MEELAVPDGWDKATVNRWLRYHSEISFELTSQRTALESALIPITAYIVIGCVEAYRRYPELMLRIADAMPPEDIGRAGRGLGLEIDTVRMWSIANFHFVGRSALMQAGVVDFQAQLPRPALLLHFLGGAARAVPRGGWEP